MKRNEKRDENSDEDDEVKNFLLIFYLRNISLITMDIPKFEFETEQIFRKDPTLSFSHYDDTGKYVKHENSKMVIVASLNLSGRKIRGWCN